MSVTDGGGSLVSAGDITLASYEAAADRYLAASPPPPPPIVEFLDHFAELVGRGKVLELGSGPGWDAAHLEDRGIEVVRSDGARPFVDRLRAAGHDAHLLDMRTDDLGGPYSGLLACAVLLHLDRREFIDVLRRARLAVPGSGILGFTVKEGEGEDWSDAKLDLPRRFIYWREPAVREALALTGWRCLSVQRVQGRLEPWLLVLAEGAPP